MKKDDLLANLQEAQNMEEGATAIYYDHIHALLSRVDSDEEFIKEIQNTLELLSKENKRHEQLCQKLYQQVKEEKSDVI
ncbi:MAG: hypothetical protein ACQEP8_02160 [Chlamydiota bacterium]